MNLQRFLCGRRYTAIEHAFVNGKVIYHCLTLDTSKKTLSVAQKKSHSSVEKCCENISKKHPILLVINNQQVLSKIVEKQFDNSLEAANFCFPNLLIEDFYIEITTHKTLSMVSICRKEIVEKIIETYKIKNRAITGFSIGNSALRNSIPYFNNTSFQSSNASFHLDNNKQLKSIEWEQKTTLKTYNLNGLKISNYDLLGFSAILNFYTQQNQHLHNFLDRNRELLKNFSHRKGYYHGTRIGTGVLFTILLLNTLFFFKYQNEIKVFKESMPFNKVHDDQRTAMKIEIEQKKGLVNTIAAHSNSTVSWYLDELGISIPSTVLLSKIHYQPILKKVKQDKEILFDARKIIISGTTSVDENFTEWIKNLESKSWVKSCAVLGYGTGKNTKTSFTIHLAL